MTPWLQMRCPLFSDFCNKTFRRKVVVDHIVKDSFTTYKSIPPENIRKPIVFYVFRGYRLLGAMFNSLMSDGNKRSYVLKEHLFKYV